MNRIAYREGYWYQLAEDHIERIEIAPGRLLWTEYV